MNGNYFFAVLLFLLLSKPACPQVEGQFVEAGLDNKCPFTITAYSTKQGLPQSQVVDIHPKRDGSLIVTTANGIAEYDGHDFREFIPNSQYKAHMYHKVLWDEQTQRLFAASYNGLYSLFPRYSQLRSCRTATMAHGKLYTFDDHGDLYVSPVDCIAFKRLADTKIREAMSVLVDGPTVYIGSTQGTYTIDLAHNNSVNKINNDTLLTFVYDPFSSGYCGVSPSAVYRIGRNSTEKLFSIERTTAHYVMDVEFTGRDTYYVATSKGLHYISGQLTRFYGKEYLSSDFLVSLYYDRQEDCLFVGTGESGMLRLQHKDCYPYGVDTQLASSSLSSIIRTAKNELLAAVSEGVIYRLRNGGVEPYWVERGSFACLGLVDSLLMVGTWGGTTYALKNGRLAYEIPRSRLPDQRVHAIFQDTRRRIWIGTDKGISRGYSVHNIYPFLSWKVKGVIICFYELRNGTVCIGSNEGAYLVDLHGNVVVLSAESGLTGREVRSFYEDAEGKLWIGTYNGGLYCYARGKLTAINKKKNCLLHSDVFTLAKDRFGYLNMTSNHGLWRVSEKDLNDFYYNRIDRLIPFALGQETGIVNTEFNGGFQNNYARTPDGRFYFPSIEGVVVFQPKKIFPRKLSPKLRRIWVNDTVYEGAPVFSRATHTLQTQPALSV
jgi:ligand-binding sensor domain-containing protein